MAAKSRDQPSTNMPDVHPSMPPGAGMSPGSAQPRWPNSRFAFLPLSEETTLSTRGQNLPAMIRNRSTASFRETARLGSFSHPSKKRLESDEDDLEIGRKRSREVTAASDLPLGYGSAWESLDRKDKKQSAAPNPLMTPEMRSQRLIGNSNPRYKWSVGAVPLQCVS